MLEEKHEDLIRQARRWVNDPNGRAELLQSITENLLINLQLEAEDGRDLGDSAADRMAARQARKQYKETAEMVIQTTKALNKELEK